MRSSSVDDDAYVENNNWRDFFNETCKKINHLEFQINKIENEINKMVYKLYQLNDEEIEIIEKNI